MNRKNHFFKRVFTVLMVVILTVSPVPLSCFVGLELPNWSEMFATRASAASEGYYTYTVSHGEATITNCNTSISGAVVIPDTLGAYPVTSIGSSAFYGCTGLTSITIPDSVTSIGSSAFLDCTGLTSITIPDSVASIGDYAFFGCTGLSRIYWNAESVSDFSSTNATFYNAGTAGAGMDIIFGDTVKSIPAFAFCVSDSSYNPKIKSVTIGNSVTSIGGSAFYDCNGLTSITIPDSVTSIGDYAFGDCNGLTSITIPDSVTSIGECTFHGCTGLTSITIPDSVTSIGSSAFNGCTGLTSITIPDSVTSIGEYAFRGCTGLTKIFWNAESVSDFYWFDNPFYNAGTAGAGMDIVFGDTVKSIPAYAFYVSDSSYNPKIKSVTIGNSVTSIGSSAFKDCTGLTSITIPDSVTSIGSSAFAGTAWYEAQPFGDVYAGKIYYKYKGTMLSNSSIVIKDGTKGIAGSAFYDCNGLTSITIPDSVTNIGSSAFWGCYDLKSIAIPDSVTNVGSSAFWGCSGLTNIIIPDSVTIVGERAFDSCRSLKSVTIGNGVETISKATFENCPLTTIKIGRNVKTIEVNAFNGIKSIPEVYYAGSESDWKSISIDQTNDMILRATMHYNVDITHTH